MVLALSPLDSAIEAAELGFRVFPLQYESKRPAVKWAELNTDDPLELARWEREHGLTGYGIPCGSLNDLLVVDLDTEEAVQWFDGLGFGGAVAHTPSGGQHRYFRTENVEIQTNASKIYPGVDIRAEGGYVVGPGSIIDTGNYVGDLSDIPDAPEALLDLLPNKQRYVTLTAQEQTLPKTEFKSTSEERKVAHAVRRMDELPRVWRDGAGWRTTAFEVSCYLRRIAGSPHYTLTLDDALQVILDHMPTDSDWGDAEILAEWEDAAKRVGDQVEPAPSEEVPPFLDADEFQHHISRETWNLSRSDAPLEEIVASAKRDGANDLVAASVAWASPAGAQLSAERQAREKIWTLTVATPAEKTAVVETGPAVPLLTKAERKRIANETWWGSDYVTWAISRTRESSASYHRLNRWTILQLALADLGYIVPRSGVQMNLCLYSALLGDTTTGKSEAWALADLVYSQFSWLDGAIFSDATREALMKNLIERDGMPTLFRRDEAHGFIRSTKTEAPFKNLPEALTELYEGRVGAILRSHDKDTSGKSAKTFFSIYFTGTFDGFTDAIEASDWESGWMNRFIFAIGEKRKEPTLEDMMLGSYESPEVTLAHREDMERTWASQFSESRRVLIQNPDTTMLIDPDVDRRFGEMRMKLYGIAQKSHYANRLDPTFHRLGNSVMKAAALIALSEAHLSKKPRDARRITMRHFLIALEQAEEWAENIIRMVAATDETPARREMKKLLAVIRGQPGSAMSRRQLFTISNKEKRFFNSMLENMIELGWVEENDAHGTPWVRAIEGSWE